MLKKNAILTMMLFLTVIAPALAADHTVSERVIKLEWCPDRERKLAYPHSIAISQLDNRQIFGIDLYDRNIGLFVRAHDFCRKIPAVPQFYLDFVRAFNHVKIRENVTIRSNDKAGAFALDRSWRAGVSPWIILIRGTLEEQVIERRAFGDIVFLRNFNNDNTWRDSLEDFSKSIIQLMNDIFAGFSHGGRHSLRRDSLRLRRKRCIECNAQGQNG